jgi:SET domain-containing protein
MGVRKNVRFCFISGYGLFATESISKGEFLLEYCGDKIVSRETDSEERQEYMFHFKHGSKSYW